MNIDRIFFVVVIFVFQVILEKKKKKKCINDDAVSVSNASITDKIAALFFLTIT